MASALLTCNWETLEGFSFTPTPTPVNKGGERVKGTHTDSSPSIFPVLPCQWSWFPSSSCLICPGGNNSPQDIFSLLADCSQRQDTDLLFFTSMVHPTKTQFQTLLVCGKLPECCSAKALQRNKLPYSSVCSGQQLTSCFANRGFKGPILKIPKNLRSHHILTPCRPKWIRISEISGFGFY